MSLGEHVAAAGCVLAGLLMLFRARWIARTFRVRGSSRDQDGAWTLAAMHLIDDRRDELYRFVVTIATGLGLLIVGALATVGVLT